MMRAQAALDVVLLVVCCFMATAVAAQVVNEAGRCHEDKEASFRWCVSRDVCLHAAAAEHYIPDTACVAFH